MEKRKKFADFVIKYRQVLMIFFVVLAVASAYLMTLVKVNYDLSKYLPDDSKTKIAIKIMEDQFGASGTSSIMVENVDQTQAIQIKQIVENVPGVSQVAFDLTSESYYKESTHKALYKVFFEEGDYTQGTSSAIKELRAQLATYEASFAGSAVSADASRGAIGGEIGIILLVVVAIVLLILTLTARSWLEPLVYLIVIAVAILINMGTNLILGEISYVTQSISAIMLIALEMDYCIVLCSRFREEYEKSHDARLAMKEALASSLIAIIASSGTVIAGLVALMFMKFSIGFDIGIVLAKGVLISVIAVIFFMPGVILALNKLLQKTVHRTFLPKMDKVAGFAHKSRKIVPLVFLAVIVAGFVLQTNVPFTYVVENNNDKSVAYQQAAKIEENFGKQNSLVLMVPTAQNATDIHTQQSLFNYVTTLKLADEEESYINSATSLSSTPFFQEVSGIEIAFAYPILPAELIRTIFQSYGKDADVVTDKIFAIDLVKYLHNHPEIVNALVEAAPPSQKAEVLQKMQELEATYQQYAVLDTLLVGENYTRMIFNLNLSEGNQTAIDFVRALDGKIGDFYQDYHIASATMNTIDTINTFKSDRLTTDLIIVVGILLIVAIAFRSLSIPVLLVLAIQGAIWINLGLSTIFADPIFFVCYLLAVAIQMGATIDYGILLTERYRTARHTMSKLDSMKVALNASLPTILTSGLILILSAFTIGVFSSIPLISEIGFLIGKGALVSVLVVIFVLPQVLMLFDKVIEKTTLKAKFLPENNKK